MTFGKYPALPLADARDKVREVLESAMGGVDPWRTASTAPKTFEALIEEFERRHLPNLKPKTRIQYRNALNHFAKRFKGRDPVTINKREVRAMLDDMVDDGTPIHANRNLAVVRKLFNWAVERSIMDMTPYYGLKAPSKEKQRTRFLSMSEIKSLWSALDSVHPIQAAFVKTLLLTGQRRETVATMRRSNIESGVWTIPREKMKGDRTHSIPLSSQLLELIESLSRQGDEDIVITHDGRSTFSGYSKLKHRLDEAAPMDEWRYHDLRRTAGTHIARLGFQRLVVSKILGHVESGVTQIDELHSYDGEKRTALQAWADEVFESCESNPFTDLFSTRSPHDKSITGPGGQQRKHIRAVAHDLVHPPARECEPRRKAYIAARPASEHAGLRPPVRFGKLMSTPQVLFLFFMRDQSQASHRSLKQRGHDETCGSGVRTGRLAPFSAAMRAGRPCDPPPAASPRPPHPRRGAGRPAPRPGWHRCLPARREYPPPGARLACAGPDTP